MKVESELPEKTKLIEVGCGNGRDASYFAVKGHTVTALDISESAIKLCTDKYRGLSIRFQVGKLSVNELKAAAQLDYHYPYSVRVLYCRFVLHAMPLQDEIELLLAANEVLPLGGAFYIECRSIKDPLASKGKVLSRTERVHGHYRRFIVLEELVARLEASGFQVIEQTEQAGLAIHANDDPVVIRIKAKKIGLSQPPRLTSLALASTH